MWAAPLLMAANCSPTGGSNSPPQQTGEPSRRRAQGALIETNLSSMACEFPYPQQTGEPSGRRAHVWSSPLLRVECCSSARKPGGGVGYGVAVGVGVKVGVGVGGTSAVQWPQPSDALNPASVGRIETDAGATVVPEKATSSPESPSRLRRAHSHRPETLAAS